MQVNKQNIKRPSLIESFFNEELTPSNDFVTYIDCSTKSSNIVHKKSSATSNSHNIKKSLKNKKSYLLKLKSDIWWYTGFALRPRNHKSLQTA